MVGYFELVMAAEQLVVRLVLERLAEWSVLGLVEYLRYYSEQLAALPAELVAEC